MTTGQANRMNITAESSLAPLEFSKLGYVYRFGGGVAEGGRADKNLLGGKGANLAEMTLIGLPVPPGFTVSTQMCRRYYDEGKALPETLETEILSGIEHIEAVTGKRFGDASDPLLVSVRSGARASMPGMMDTVLNLGLNDVTVEALAAVSGNARFAWDSYRRFIQMYADVVLGLDDGAFEEALEILKEDRGLTLDTDLSATDLRQLVSRFKSIVDEQLGSPFPQDVYKQLWGAIEAVFGSWQSDRAKVYRRLNNIPSEWGTAVNIQAMVFGNMGDTSATGVAFTRDPSTGDPGRYGEFLINAQGEDVVSGIRTPRYLTKRSREEAGSSDLSMEEAMPAVYAELAAMFETLERHYRDMQDIEFTVEQGRLWLLQTRSAKRTAKAALKIAVDMAEEGLITKDEAVARIDPASLDQLLHPVVDQNAPRDLLTKGLPASPGAASGIIAFDADMAERSSAAGADVILVRTETSPKDIHGMHAACGILTARGGMTSHAAVVARGMGRPCVSGAGAITIDLANRVMRIGQREVREGDRLTIDGSTGDVMLGDVAMIEPELDGDLGTLLAWADSFRRMKVRANAETPDDCRVALEFGAEGIGLCRTEHMFFNAARIMLVRQMIMAQDEIDRRAALEKLLPEQRNDFIEIFLIMAGLPCTIRLLDPPLHEFLPTEEGDIEEIAAASGVPIDAVRLRASELHEINPMLGHRGCRLGVTYPEIYEMQARAIFEAAVEVSLDTGNPTTPEIMIPLVATRRELDLMKVLVDRTAETVFAEKGHRVSYLIGTMIELPRAALLAGDIAEAADFFSFGTNDLTQTTLGVSRDDAARFLDTYVDQRIYPADPFVTLDVEGVGALVRLAAERGRVTRPDIKLGICGEHGGDPASIAFCEEIGLDYVSASPYRIPITKLAAAQSYLRLNAND